MVSRSTASRTTPPSTGMARYSRGRHTVVLDRELRPMLPLSAVPTSGRSAWLSTSGRSEVVTSESPSTTPSRLIKVTRAFAISAARSARASRRAISEVEKGIPATSSATRAVRSASEASILALSRATSPRSASTPETETIATTSPASQAVRRSWRREIRLRARVTLRSGSRPRGSCRSGRRPSPASLAGASGGCRWCAG